MPGESSTISYSQADSREETGTTRRAILLALTVLFLSPGANAMTDAENLLLLTCAAAIASIDSVPEELSKEERMEVCALAKVRPHEPIGPVILERMRAVAGVSPTMGPP